jgi:hypothetical protein
MDIHFERRAGGWRCKTFERHSPGLSSKNFHQLDSPRTTLPRNPIHLGDSQNEGDRETRRWLTNDLSDLRTPLMYFSSVDGQQCTARA